MQTEVERLELLSKAKQLVESIEAKNDTGVSELLSAMTMDQENNLFKEVGHLTRQLHDNLSSFGLDEQLVALTGRDIPDAKERLNYVIEMTDDAAHKTLNAIDEILPVTTEMQKKSEELSKNWKRFLSRELSLEEFKEMSGEISKFLESSCENTKIVSNKTNEIVLAQGYQDITGQIIKKVIGLVQNVEDSLVDLVRIAGSHEDAVSTPAEEKKGVLEGPVIPGIVVEGAVNSQDEVDDLLSSLGF